MNQKKPLISVVVPVYNVEQYLGRCMESILVQTYTNLEIILVDDGSTDESGIICDKYAEQFNNVKVIHQTNKGSSAARQAGVELANGDWIGFVDSDDWIESFMYETLIKQAMRCDAIDISCAQVILHKEGETINYAYCGDEIIYSAREALSSMIKDASGESGFGYVGSFCCSIFRKSLFHKNVFSKIVYWEDLYGTWQLLRDARRVIYTPQVTYHYCKREGNLTSEFFSMKMLTYLTVPLMIDRCIRNTYIRKDTEVYNMEKNLARLIFKSLCIYIRYMCEYGKDGRYDRYINCYQEILPYYKEKIERNLTDNDIRAYRLAMMRRLAYERYACILRRKILAFLLKSKKKYVYIYGAGKVSKDVISFCSRNNIAIDGVIVSKQTFTNKNYRGMRVVVINELKKNLSDMTVALLALNRKNVAEVVPMLKKKKITYLDVGCVSPYY